MYYDPITYRMAFVCIQENDNDQYLKSVAVDLLKDIAPLFLQYELASPYSIHDLVFAKDIKTRCRMRHYFFVPTRKAIAEDYYQGLLDDDTVGHIAIGALYRKVAKPFCCKRGTDQKAINDLLKTCFGEEDEQIRNEKEKVLLRLMNEQDDGLTAIRYPDTFNEDCVPFDFDFFCETVQDVGSTKSKPWYTDIPDEGKSLRFVYSLYIQVPRFICENFTLQEKWCRALKTLAGKYSYFFGRIGMDVFVPVQNGIFPFVQKQEPVYMKDYLPDYDWCVCYDPTHAALLGNLTALKENWYTAEKLENSALYLQMTQNVQIVPREIIRRCAENIVPHMKSDWYIRKNPQPFSLRHSISEDGIRFSDKKSSIQIYEIDPTKIL